LLFVDGIFDVVFRVGGINFFNDKARAIAEMIRVARPGTKIVIVDESGRMRSLVAIRTQPFTGQPGIQAIFRKCLASHRPKSLNLVYRNI